jgi:hypothetical protein
MPWIMKNEQVTVRLPPEMRRRIDAYAKQLDAERPGSTHGRSDALKVLLALHLPPLSARPEAQATPPPKSKATASRRGNTRE